MLDFLKQNFDKFLLTGVFIYIFHAVLNMAYAPGIDASVIAWARESAGTILGALLGLITGYQLGKASAAAIPPKESMTDYTIVLPAQVKPFTDLALVALTVWREASGESLEGKQAVAWVIRNRVIHPSWYGRDWCEVVTKKAQFSSMAPPDHVDDPNLRRYPSPADGSWIQTIQAVFDVMCSNISDPTGGATFYYDRSLDKTPPVWAAKYTHTADIGNFHFYKP